MKKFKLGMSLFLIALLSIFILGGCAKEPAQNSGQDQGQEPANKEIILATTTSTQDSGLLDYLLPIFEEQSKIKVKVVAVGTGQAIQTGKDGNADVLLVHARADEDKFVEEGFGENAWDVMYNQFLVVGPDADPAGVKSAQDVTEAFKKIADQKATFISRGDDSGTHKKELKIWKDAGIEPAGDWYVSIGQGMGATLQMADEKKGYTLTDEATFLATKELDLKVVREGDKSLLNPYGIMKVKSTKKPQEADEFIKFMTGEEGQKLIGEFKKAELGKGLFVPSAKER